MDNICERCGEKYDEQLNICNNCGLDSKKYNCSVCKNIFYYDELEYCDEKLLCNKCLKNLKLLNKDNNPKKNSFKNYFYISEALIVLIIIKITYYIFNDEINSIFDIVKETLKSWGYEKYNW